MVDPKRGPRSRKVAVIGAGAAGLVTARELLREGHHVTVFEQNDTIGGIWNYQEEYEADDLLGRDPNRRHVHSSMYSTLRTNLPRQIMSFSDFPFIPEVMGDKSHDPRRFPSHKEVLAWLSVFATTYDLWNHIRFSTRIVSLQPLVAGATDTDTGLNPGTAKGTDTGTDTSTDTSKYRPSDQLAGPQWQLRHTTLPCRNSTPHFQSDASFASKTAASPAKAMQTPPASSSQQSQDTQHPSHRQAQQSMLSSHNCSASPVGEAEVGSADSAQQPTAGESSEGGSVPHQQRSVKANSLTNHAVPTQLQSNGNGHQQIFKSPAQEPDGLRSAASSPDDGAFDAASDAHEQTDIFDAVVCCVGNYHQPNLPQVDGIDSFLGLQMHAHNYRTNAIFAGKRVMVIGSSFSGEEIARLVANVATHVYHSARSFAKQAPLRSNLTRVAMLTKLDKDHTATLQDGNQLEGIDAVVYCTGYQYAYPFLEGTGLIKSQDMRVDPLWMHILPPSVAPTLAFVGLLQKSLRNWQFQLQAKLVARVLSGRSQLPSRHQMEQDVADFYKLLKDSKVPVRYTHNQEDGTPMDQFVYNAKLARVCGSDARTHPDWIKSLYVQHVGGNILRKPDTFRDTWDEVELETFDHLDRMCAEMLMDLRPAETTGGAG